MLSLPVLVTVACSGGAGTGASSGPASDGSSGGGDEVTSDSVSTSASTSSASPSTSAASTGDVGTMGNASTGDVGTTGDATTGDVDPTNTGTNGVAATGSSTTAASASAGPTTSTSAVSSGTTGSTPTDEVLSFARDIFPLWEMVREPAWQYRGTGSYSGCNVDGVCHGGAAPGAGLMMADAASTHAELVDVPSASTLCAGTLRVVAGAPEASCLVLFYQGRLGNDDLGWVDDAEIELMREWILQGALP